VTNPIDTLRDALEAALKNNAITLGDYREAQGVVDRLEGKIRDRHAAALWIRDGFHDIRGDQT
jgi:predicted RNA-binding protein associated with RNAse of E/G family